ncbi:uncharacterized protein LOC132039069 [Lycium ferocissimum]|uniref:uncharacterized protein LOC132039069 n=1 Tax=Lycium ferocissimum TaxID=112874 RepID=UPI002814CCA1|nr:uncharacterized protein LOC132039069 [Lycium ferocissimum]
MKLCTIRDKVLSREAKEAILDDEGVLRRICIPRVSGLTKLILEEADSSRYSTHPLLQRCQVFAPETGWYDLKNAPEWKWERIAMDFMVGLPKNLDTFDAIWVIVDRLTKFAHFIPVQTTYNAEKLTRIYIRKIVRLHGVPISIISDRGTQLTSYFWRTLQKELGTQLDHSTAIYQQIDDLLREYLDKVKIIHEKLLAAQSRKKEYAEWKVRDLELMVGDQVLLKILRHIGEVACELALPPGLVGVHLMFQVSMLKKYHSDRVDQNLSFEEKLVAILDMQVRKLRSKEIASVKMQWKHHPVEEATWEIEDDMCSRYPHLFTDSVNSFLCFSFSV